VRRNGLRLLKLVNTLLDFSRLEAGRLQVLYEPIDVAAYTADLASTFQSARTKPACATWSIAGRWQIRPSLIATVGEDRPQPYLERVQVHLRR